jgi:hypothetical protein
VTPQKMSSWSSQRNGFRDGGVLKECTFTEIQQAAKLDVRGTSKASGIGAQGIAAGGGAAYNLAGALAAGSEVHYHASKTSTNTRQGRGVV